MDFGKWKIGSKGRVGHGPDGRGYGFGKPCATIEWTIGGGIATVFLSDAKFVC